MDGLGVFCTRCWVSTNFYSWSCGCAWNCPRPQRGGSWKRCTNQCIQSTAPIINRSCLGERYCSSESKVSAPPNLGLTVQTNTLLIYPSFRSRNQNHLKRTAKHSERGKLPHPRQVWEVHWKDQGYFHGLRPSNDFGVRKENSRWLRGHHQNHRLRLMYDKRSHRVLISQLIASSFADLRLSRYDYLNATPEDTKKRVESIMKLGDRMSTLSKQVTRSKGVTCSFGKVESN